MQVQMYHFIYESNSDCVFISSVLDLHNCYECVSSHVLKNHCFYFYSIKNEPENFVCNLFVSQKFW